MAGGTALPVGNLKPYMDDTGTMTYIAEKSNCMEVEMRAFLVHDEKKEIDLIVVPEQEWLVDVNRDVMNDFISVNPDFTKWTGRALKGLTPESFGQIIATREEKGDVCIVEASLWHQRMAFHLGNP